MEPRPARAHFESMDLLVVGPVLAASLVATLIVGKAVLRSVVAVLERRGRG